MQEETNNVITIVLTADNHLGATIPGQPPRKREQQRQRQRHAFGQAVDFAIGQGVDLFLQVGDLFDTPHPDEQDRSTVAARLAALKQAGIRVFALGGVHDTPAETHSILGDAAAGSPAPLLSYASLGALHYFPPNDTPAASRRTLQPVTLDIRGVPVALCGLGVTAGQQGDPLAHIEVDTALERVAIPLLLLHAPIEGITGGRSALDMQSLVARASIASQPAFRFILAGYHHAFTRLSIGSTDVIVAGATQHIHFDDPDAEPGFVFLGLAADGVRWCRHITVESVQLRRLIIPVADLGRAESSVGAGLAPALEKSPISSDASVSEPDTTTSEIPTSAPAESDTIKSEATASESAPTASGTLTSDAAIQAPDSGVPDQAVSDPTARILEQLRPLCTEDAMVQVRLTGELTRQRYHQLDLNRLRRYGEEHALAFIIDDSSVTFLPDAVGTRHVPVLENSPIASVSTRSTFSTSDIEERLSPRDELMLLADEWIAAADDEQERQALVATKEELLAALWNL